MVTQTVRLAVDLAINEGRLDAFERIMQAMVVVSQKEPGTLGYEWFLNADRRRCRLLETYVDANALQSHLNGPAVHELVPKLLEVASVRGFEVYGDPGPKASAMLAGFGAEVFDFWSGLNR
jgi:quinol monooxygenase YgiN